MSDFIDKTDLIDTHAHLDHCDGAPATLVEEAARAGVTAIIQSGTDTQSSELAVEMAERFPAVYATVGVHPHEASAVGEGDMGRLAELAAHPKVVGIGETGLDYYRNRSPQADQKRVFAAEIELAQNLALPVIIHTRQADVDSIPLLRKYAADTTVLLHCFSLPERLEELLSYGFYISFAGNVTFKKAVALQEAARMVPADRFIIETDAPYLGPEPFRGRPNTPAKVRHTYEFIAALRGVPVEELAAQVWRNVEVVFPKLEAHRHGRGASES
jgi:TatD DNase family protein